MPAPDDTIYLVYEFPNASEKKRFLEMVKIHRFTQMKQIEEKFRLSHYMIRQALSNKETVGTTHLFLEKVVYNDVLETPVALINKAPGLSTEKTAADFILSFD